MGTNMLMLAAAICMGVLPCKAMFAPIEYRKMKYSDVGAEVDGRKREQARSTKCYAWMRGMESVDPKQQLTAAARKEKKHTIPAPEVDPATLRVAGKKHFYE